ncbi:MAG: hypothetical protein KJ583_07365 [Nanoarchaeota archaeon]|nr:hypothetical protein [Nanoarchaeota archaeon]MBU1269144.1 hypothetical protein [Nanoarchaeota archaeon]MBU1605106.1 hypothetical protein [Nanoarchaeota archaeon]MBU2442787.1 hypothetical protein [Nanoarchaeota archaeon]
MNLNITKKKKPSFLRTDAHKKKRVGKKWIRPKGLHNKRRLLKRGYAPVISPGYQNDKRIKGKREGLDIIVIRSIDQLESVDKKTQGIVISSKLGSKKRLEVLEKADKQGIRVFNFNVNKKITEIKTLLEERKKKKDEQKQRKEKKKKEEKKEKEKKEETIIDDKKEQEKKELDKILTKKQ